MRAYLASSIGVACTAALVLPLSLPSGAVASPQAPVPHAAVQAAPRTAVQATTSRTALSAPSAADPRAVAGSTQSLPLAPLATDRATGVATVQGLARRDVRPFSLLGVVWDNADDELNGTVQVRTRATGTQVWSGWLDLETHNQEHGADLGTEERSAATVHGATAPLWVGDSDGVELRVRAVEEPSPKGPARPLLPRGLRLELVDPGAEPTAATTTAGGPQATRPDGPSDTPVVPGTVPGTPAEEERMPVAMTAGDAASSAVNADLAELGATEIAAQTKEQTEADLADQVGFAQPYIGARPRIITRKGWGADENLRERKFGYTKSVKAAFVHHSATGNNYTCAQAPSVLRGIYRYHVVSSGWRDIGYNFAIDKCGNIYEGRAGGVAKPVMGAHTLGFNTNSVGIAVLGTYSSTNPPAAATTAIAKLTAWKLGLYGVNPRGKSTLTSGGSNKYKKGTKVALNAISGHRDGFVTECPGSRLYEKLGTTRTTSAKYQGR
ncbi:peptidoglycan recognition protein family protein [Streptomyces liangshanensis]|uniref:peptidoglycan recognition protein family protein n=1 Tax=Streptomyces liangshanensis TaxID=2717324 RepID=UPI0036D82506